ncbi:hypothetical protein CLOLEP_03714 [[Clostridium] leptum DSM 753]|uniref:Uncharacterized protein n=1 Tax=[Clostridium] leptum DSM 753 TaxID=428125 RepID=A7VYN6_9FIRM|nr:hypothetical protein CLOLEP_03714 [[Clostridium] leptum DSM 753]
MRRKPSVRSLTAAVFYFPIGKAPQPLVLILSQALNPVVPLGVNPTRICALPS